ncbi:hypothetical protein H2199_004815 [Coniosporium tulheliwenetii]|uniref:Uncharacterized protein n=1 Tax=Coniosporium tulheliwenetii TaxID=3383036 RepID=A0ACC2Z4Z6_9PEZI|nr:hypothetical protein H2199_004815 [Cladosporium sp. JES 115]
MVLGFFAPEAVEEYATQAVVFEPTRLAINSFTDSGVRAHIEGDFTMDASRVKKKSVRDFGRFATWIAKEVETEPTDVEVYLPEYGNVVLGAAKVPRIKVDIRNGHTTHVDFLTDLEPGEIGGIRRVANDWIDGKLSQLRVRGKADVAIQSGIIHLGKQTIEQSLVFQGNDLPTVPAYNISKINFHEVNLPFAHKGMAADVSLTVQNNYPVDFTIPPLGFAILVDNCSPTDPYIMMADATTEELHIEPRQDVHLNVSGIVRQLPDALTTACPGSHESPLDALLGDYIHGSDATIYVRGSDSPSLDTPKWITDLISDITVPVPFPGRQLDHLLKSFSLADVQFHLPEPFAEPDTPEAQPKISAKVKALVALPEEMSFPVRVDRVKADADVYYHGKKLGNLDLHKWQKANSSRIEADKDGQPALEVESRVNKAPLTITDDDLFSEVVQALIFGGKPLILGIKAKVDVEIETALGKFAVRKIPAEGVVPVKPIGNKGGFASLGLQVGDIDILQTGPSSLILQAEVNFTNPTEYSATVPYVNVNILNNGTVLGQATAKDVVVVPGPNKNIVVEVLWDPLASSGKKGAAVGRELLSQYISGYNTTLTIKPHNGTIPAQPTLGKALSGLSIEMPTPKLRAPKSGHDDDSDDDEDASPNLHRNLHPLLPLRHSTIYLTHINATAYYHDEPIGRILYDLPFAVPPGESQSPRLPVDWSLGSVGYEAVRKALGESEVECERGGRGWDREVAGGGVGEGTGDWG